MLYYLYCIDAQYNDSSTTAAFEQHFDANIFQDIEPRRTAHVLVRVQ